MVNLTPPPSGMSDKLAYDYLYQLQEFLGTVLGRVGAAASAPAEGDEGRMELRAWVNKLIRDVRDELDGYLTTAEFTAFKDELDDDLDGKLDADTAYAAGESIAGPARMAVGIPFGSVDGTSTATAMTATVPGIAALRHGVCAMIVNGVVTSASGWTLDVNGLGAKPVYQTMAAASRTTTVFNINYTMLFVYNEERVEGGCWDIYYGYNSDNNTLAYNVRTQQTDRVLGDRLSRYMFLFTQRDGTLVPSYTVASGNGSTGTTKTLNTGKAFDPKRPILYYGTTTNVASGNSPGGSYLYRQYYACEMRYAFNAGTTLTAKTPVYVRCVPNVDGTVQLDGNDCLVQALPSSEDGKVYIYLGMAYGDTGYNMELDPEHPAYQYKDGALQPWT